MNEAIRELAAVCARTLPAGTGPDGEPSAAFTAALEALVAALSREPRFMFDAAGRPGAVAAVRNALPPSEAELLGAILEDVAAELGAHREALYLVLQTRNPDPEP
jgi:hypothetical protein